MKLKEYATVTSHRWSASVLLLIMLFSSALEAAEGIWLNIDVDERAVFVMEGDRAIQTFHNIAMGKNGVTPDKVLNDGKTPLGSYRIRRINDESRFHLFFGLDYPSLEQAANAYMANRISAAQLEAIYRAHERGEEPSSSTPLGGAIGIHGVGSGDMRIHENFDWTDGCIALTNEQVDELAKWIGLGTLVVVRSSSLN
jgi:murein L,D-transpeptidase YafK